LLQFILKRKEKNKRNQNQIKSLFNKIKLEKIVEAFSIKEIQIALQICIILRDKVVKNKLNMITKNKSKKNIY
jgi:hypothetical protein